MQIQTHTARAGQVASLQLGLIDAKADLAKALNEQQVYRQGANESRALAAEQLTARDRETHYGNEIQRRMQATACQPKINRIKSRVAAIQRELDELTATEAAIGEVMA